MNKEERLKQDGVAEDGMPVLFYGPAESYGEFSNFSRHAIWLPHPFTCVDTKYLTGEHRFQAMKAMTDSDHNFVNASLGPNEAKLRGGPILTSTQGITLRQGWGNNYGDLCWYVMVEVVMAKAMQHPTIKDLLLKTANDQIYEDSPTDDIWGWRFRKDYRGKNLLGRAWMEVRHILSEGKY